MDVGVQVVELAMRVGLQVSEVAGEQELILCLSSRTGCDAEETGKLAFPLATAALGNVGRYGCVDG